PRGERGGHRAAHHALLSEGKQQFVAAHPTRSPGGEDDARHRGCVALSGHDTPGSASVVPSSSAAKRPGRRRAEAVTHRTGGHPTRALQQQTLNVSYSRAVRVVNVQTRLTVEGRPTREGNVRIGVPRETLEGERRVALMPDAVSRLVRAGVEVVVEAGAGAAAFAPDEAYAKAGAQ